MSSVPSGNIECSVTNAEWYRLAEGDSVMFVCIKIRKEEHAPPAEFKDNVERRVLVCDELTQSNYRIRSEHSSNILG